MTQKEKQLLLKDLCTRLPYRVIVQVKDWTTLDTELKTGHIRLLQDGVIELKPYLRPMESMTEEEDNEWNGLNIDPLLEAVKERHTRIEDLTLRAKSQYKPLDYLIAHHFDYRGLIEKGLAIAVTKEVTPQELYSLLKYNRNKIISI